MAPTIPTVRKRSVPRARLPKPSTASSSLTNKRKRGKDRGLLGVTSKKDKRTIRHSVLLSRIEKFKATIKKRRRPSKKLVTNLESLADALPYTSTLKLEDKVIGEAKIRHRSLKSRPGAQKKKEKLASMEKDRFNKNMAQMMAPAAATQHSPATPGVDGGESSSRNKWTALRGFIQQTMERRPEAGT